MKCQQNLVRDKKPSFFGKTRFLSFYDTVNKRDGDLRPLQMTLAAPVY